ncbi:MAG: hydrogen peroxide-inducible genes activator [Alphaproteobacteria bacterium]|nr:hydrogen peroxide-inducible genes activator [Alphaproteobacteria bacterium]
MIRPTLRQLEYLTAIEDTGSFSLAAEHCHVTQSTLSAGIKELETTLNQKMVERGGRGRGVTLTPFGQYTADCARLIFTQTDNILAHSRALAAPLSGPLRLGVIPTIAPYLLPGILPVLQKKFPALELQLHEDLTDRLLEALRRAQLDAVLMAFPFDTPGMTRKHLFHENFLVAAPKGHAHTSPYKTEDLNGEKLLLLEDGHCLRDHALSACGIQRPRQRKTFSATSLPTIIQMVNHGFGITLLPEMAAKHGFLPDGLTLIPFKSAAPGREIALTWMQDHAKAEDFMLLSETIIQLQNL